MTCPVDGAFDQPVVPWEGGPARWRHFTPEQRRRIANGCGPKGSPIPVPSFLFTASCNIHDFNYSLGRTKADRKKADRQFLEAMCCDADLAGSLWRRAYYRSWACLYYQAVRACGAMAFHFSDNERTYEEMIALAEED